MPLLGSEGSGQSAPVYKMEQAKQTRIHNVITNNLSRKKGIRRKKKGMRDILVRMPFGIVSESIKHKQRKKNVSPTYKEMFFYSFDLLNRVTT